MLAAHAGHWAVGLLYAVPVFAVLIALGISIRRERRREAEGGSREGGADEEAAPGGDQPAAGLDEPGL
jgi:cytochrome c-type biogenesis protein CcmH/NrfF